MKTIVKPVYYCEYCNKKGLSKHAMQKHENECMSNPKNFRACLMCNHCKPFQLEVKFESEHTRYTRSFNTFQCKKLNILLYHPKAEFKGLTTKYPETFQDQEPMRKECEHHVSLGIDRSISTDFSTDFYFWA